MSKKKQTNKANKKQTKKEKQEQAEKEKQEQAEKEKREQAEKEKREQAEKEKRVARYLMYEYPSHLVRLKPVCMKNSSKLYQKFYRNRRLSIKASTWLYWIVFGLLLIQLVFLILPCIWKISSHWAIVGLKILGLSLWLSSFPAWLNQLWKDSEYYGLVLGNYSRYEPIDHVLKDLFHVNDERTRIFLGDWMRNRPSLTFLLITALLGLYAFPVTEGVVHVGSRLFPQLFANSGNLSAFIKNPPLAARIILQSFISSFLFLLSLPLPTDFSYYRLHTAGQKFAGKRQNNGEKSAGINHIFIPVLVLFLVFVILSVSLSFISPEWLAAVIMLSIASLIFLGLWGLARVTRRRKDKEDNHNLNVIKFEFVKIEKENTATSIDNDKIEKLYKAINEAYRMLSCKGQLTLLKRIKNNEIKVCSSAGNNLSNILFAHAHSPLVVEELRELIRLDLIR